MLKVRILPFLTTFTHLTPRLKNFLRSWWLILGLKDGLVKCATVCIKSEVILLYWRGQTYANTVELEIPQIAYFNQIKNTSHFFNADATISQIFSQIPLCYVTFIYFFYFLDHLGWFGCCWVLWQYENATWWGKVIWIMHSSKEPCWPGSWNSQD